MVELNDFQRDALREIGNVGSGNAITTLSKFVDIQIRQGLSFMDIQNVKDILMFMGGGGGGMCVIHSVAEGEVEGALLTIFPGKSSMILADMLQKRPVGTANQLADEDLQRIINVGEALTDTYIETLVSFLGLSMKRSSSAKVVDDPSKLMGDLTSRGYNNALMLETDFGIPDKGLEGDFILLLNDKSIDNVLSAVSKMLENK